MTPKTAEAPTLRLALVLCLALATAWLGACSSGGVRGEAPFAQVTGWRIDGHDLQASLRLRNVNSETLVVDELYVNIELDGTLLAQHQARQRFEIAANGFETVELAMTASDAGVAALQRLQAGETGSLRTAITGHVTSPDEGRLEFRRDGHIYTVPGRPGEFR